MRCSSAQNLLSRLSSLLHTIHVRTGRLGQSVSESLIHEIDEMIPFAYQYRIEESSSLKVQRNQLEGFSAIVTALVFA